MTEVTIKQQKGLSAIFKQLGELSRNIFHSKLKEESISFSSLWEQVWMASWDLEDWYFLIDLYIEESTGEIFGIFSCEGKLYRASIAIDSSNTAIIGELTQVKEVFEPVENSFLITNMADGGVRWFLIACSSVLNRSASIDSSLLFDNLIKRCNDTGQFPYLTYYHLDEPLKMGTTDWLARDGNLLLMSGLFDEDNEIAECMKRAYADDPEYWGASISFWASEGRMEQIAENIFVPMYTDGTFKEVSILAEEHANCLFTSMYSDRKVIQMNDEIKQQLKKLFGGNEDLLNKVVDQVDASNQLILDENLVRRSTPKIAPAEPIQEPSSPVDSSEPTPVEDAKVSASKEIEVDDDLVKTIVEQMVKHPAVLEAFKPISDLIQSMEKLQESMEEKTTALESSSSELKQNFESRLNELEKSEEKKKEEWQNDLPKNQTLKINYRPKEQEETHDDKLTRAEIADQTLQKINAKR